MLLPMTERRGFYVSSGCRTSRVQLQGGWLRSGVQLPQAPAVGLERKRVEGGSAEQMVPEGALWHLDHRGQYHRTIRWVRLV